MNRRLLSLLSAAAIAAATVFAAPETPKQPLYIYMYAGVTDHVNIQISEERLHRLLPMIETYAKQHPEAHVSATIFFTGAMSQALTERNSTTHILDFVKGYLRSGVIEVGYDGTDEPTYKNRPVVDFTQTMTPQERWVARRTAEEKFLNEGRDPLTGAPQPNSSGGLKKMLEVFGKASCVTGISVPMKLGPTLPVPPVTRASREPVAPKDPVVPQGTMPEVGADSEAMLYLRQFNPDLIAFGIPDLNPARIPGFRAGLAGFSKLISPLPQTPPELFWQDYVVRSSDTSDDTVRLVHAIDGSDPIKKLAGNIDRSKVHVIHVELDNESIYLKPEFVKSPEFPALRYAYDHPDSPRLPADVMSAKGDVDGAYAKEESLLKWIVNDFTPSNGGSRFVSNTDLNRMVAPAAGFRISTESFKVAVADFLQHWGNDTFSPPLFRVDGHYLSRAEMFQALADELAEFHRSGKLLDSVDVRPTYGPIRVLTGHGPNEGEVSVADLAKIAADVSAGLHEQSTGVVPKNSVPIAIQVHGEMLNPAQFLKLMAFAVTNPDPNAKLNIRMSFEFMGLGQLLPRTRPDTDDGFIWTLKPAELQSNFLTRASR